MPLKLTAFTEDPLFAGYTWTVDDEVDLVRLLTLLVVGDHLHALAVLRESPRPGRRPTRKALGRIASELRHPADVYQRDGWLFQLLSWIAIQRVATAGTIARAPHSIMAQKGTDGLIIELPEAGRSYIVVCEDKATERPRRTIVREVWPDFTQIEKENARERELTSEVSTLLLQLGDPARAQQLVDDAIWQDNKHYRVAVTGSGTSGGSQKRRKLFAGYDACVGAPSSRRRAELLWLPDLRAWMSRVAGLVADRLDEWGDGRDV